MLASIYFERDRMIANLRESVFDIPDIYSYVAFRVGITIRACNHSRRSVSTFSKHPTNPEARSCCQPTNQLYCRRLKRSFPARLTARSETRLARRLDFFRLTPLYTLPSPTKASSKRPRLLYLVTSSLSSSLLQLCIDSFFTQSQSYCAILVFAHHDSRFVSHLPYAAQYTQQHLIL